MPSKKDLTPLQRSGINHPRADELSADQMKACSQLASGDHVADAILGLLQKMKEQRGSG